MARSIFLVAAMVVCWGVEVLAQEQAQQPPPPTPAVGPPGAPPGARGGFRVGGPFGGPGAPAPAGVTRGTTTTSRGEGSLMSRPMPASQPMPAKVGKALSFDVLIAAQAGNADLPAAEILELEKIGKLGYVNRLRLVTLEELPAFVQFGELKARVSGRTATNVTVLPIYNDINLGSILQVTGRVAEDGSILAQIYVEQSFLDGEEGPFNPQDQSPPKAIARQLTQTTVRLKPGEPQLIGGHQAGVGAEASQSWIVVVGRVGE